jgi:hypothetical protein
MVSLKELGLIQFENGVGGGLYRIRTYDFHRVKMREACSSWAKLWAHDITNRIRATRMLIIMEHLDMMSFCL